MPDYTIPTSADIRLEADGKRIAVVQNYEIHAKSNCIAIGEFGSNSAVAVVHGPMQYSITLSRVYATDEAISDNIRFYELENFSLVISKPDRSIVFTGCQWTELSESAKIGSTILEDVTLIAAVREEYLL
ncbi:MAG: hypothetical protein LBM28_01230 [Oscillospiraceae bacterium]|nr:hypothetical protein [Oscillospiraceae bacterium]